MANAPTIVIYSSINNQILQVDDETCCMYLRTTVLV